MIDKYTNKYHLENALRERDFEYLAECVRHADELQPDVREHLGNMILGLLTRNIKLPKHRPAKRATSDERRKIALRVID